MVKDSELPMQGGAGWIPGRGTGILHAVQHDKKKKKEKEKEKGRIDLTKSILRCQGYFYSSELLV